MESKTDPRERRLVDAFGLAAVLGVSPAAVKRLHREGRIVGYRTGKRQVRYDVEECLQRLRVGAGDRQERAS